MKHGKINRQSIAISGFTSVLSQLDGMPKSLYVKGQLPVGRPPVVAIIGSRKPSEYGKEVTRWFASSLAKRGVVIISGLAFGVDAIAHEACLEAGGTTIAVMAGGLHTVYPKSHQQLAQRIIQQGGALISEYEQGVEARPYYFLARNRLVSGLADAVLVTEATDRSGTFSTIAHAIAQNKDVFAVPGPITSLLSAGPNKIIQTGAQVACTPDDILRCIAPALFVAPKKSTKASPLTKRAHLNTRQKSLLPLLPLGDTPLEVRIIELIANGLNDGELLQQQLATENLASITDFLQALTLMELKDTIRPLGGNRWTLTSLRGE